MRTSSKTNLIIISGPSGAGEDSVIEGLGKNIPIERVITTTTRRMRPGESQGRPYYFISKRKFADGIRQNRFFEYAMQYNGNFYGATHKEVERVKRSDKIGIWKIDYKGVMAAKKKMPEVKSIIITSPLAVLEKRIRQRDKVDENYIRQRMEYTREWLTHRKIYDYTIINKQGKLDETVSKVLKIINKVLAK